VASQMGGGNATQQQPHSCVLLCLAERSVSTLRLTHPQKICSSMSCAMCWPLCQHQIVQVEHVPPRAVHGLLAGTCCCGWALHSTHSSCCGSSSSGNVASHWRPYAPLQGTSPRSCSATCCLCANHATGCMHSTGGALAEL
jgi:hypothetical protein